MKTLIIKHNEKSGIVVFKDNGTDVEVAILITLTIIDVKKKVGVISENLINSIKKGRILDCGVNQVVFHYQNLKIDNGSDSVVRQQEVDSKLFLLISKIQD